MSKNGSCEDRKNIYIKGKIIYRFFAFKKIY